MTTSGLPTPDRFSPFYILPRTRIGAYVVRKAIGRGGAQMAYLADASDGRKVVLKVSLFPKGEKGSGQRLMHERFLRQVAFFLQLRGIPGVANVFAHDMYPDTSPDGHLYMVQEWVPDSINILDWYRAQPRSLEAIVAGWMILANACGEMDRRGICHRDLKPENVLVSPLGAPKIIDFNSGLSVGAERLTFEWASKVPGTHSYKSPELCEAILTEWATRRRSPFQFRPTGDLHALGVIFYQVLTGEHPFDEHAEELELFEQIARQVPERPGALNPEVPFGLEKVVMKLLQKDPAQRYQTGDEVVEDLEALLTTSEDWGRLFQTPAGKRHTPRPRTSQTSTGAPPPTPRASAGSAALSLAPSAIVLAPPRALALRGLRVLPRPESAPAPQSAPRRRRVLLLAAALALVQVLIVALPFVRQQDSLLERGRMVLGKVKTAVVAVASAAVAACAGLTGSVRDGGDKEWLEKCPPEARKAGKSLRVNPRNDAFLLEGPNVIPHDLGVEVRPGLVELKVWLAGPEHGFPGRMYGNLQFSSDSASIRLTKLKLPEEDWREVEICAITSIRGYPHLPGIPIADDPPPEPERTPGFTYITTGGPLEIMLAQ